MVKKEIIHSVRLRNYKENFYNYIIMQVLRHSDNTIKNVKLKFDSHGEKTIRDQLRVYLSKELNNKKEAVFKDLKFEDSRQNTLIQLADMVAGSIYTFHSEKKNKKKYLTLLKNYKKIEDIWLFK